MNLIAWVFLGVIAGAATKLLFPGREHVRGWLTSLALGIAGAFAGGLLGEHIWGADGITGFSLNSFGLAFAAAVVLLVIVQLLRRRRNDRRDPGTRVRPAA